MREIALAFEEIVLCSKCASKIEERRRREERTNIHVGHLRFNIVFYHDIDNSLSKIKARIIDEDAKLTSNILLIVNTSFIIDNSRYELKNKLISTIRRKNKKIIYVNNKSSLRAFFKLVIDYIFEMNCNYWMRDLVACEPFLRENKTRYDF